MAEGLPAIGRHTHQVIIVCTALGGGSLNLELVVAHVLANNKQIANYLQKEATNNALFFT